MKIELDTNEVAALLERAPVDVRVNRLKADRAEIEALLERGTNGTGVAPN